MSDTRDRKAEHLELAAEERMQVPGSSFDDFRFVHRALPEIDLAEVDPTTIFLDKGLSAPLLISCMTGGTEEARRINRNLARGAEEAGIALGVGSQRKALEDKTQEASFQVRDLAPSVPLLANLGAVQLNYGYGVDECRRAVEMIGADALVLHLNPLQEAIQPEGDGDFSGLLRKIGEIVAALPVPIIVKEVGNGISAEVGRRLFEVGVEIVDSAGRGGTSWALIEGERAGDPTLGEVFADWGIPAAESIFQLATVPGLRVIGSGGVRDGVDVAKAISLGADLVGIAQPFLLAAVESAAAVTRRARRLTRELTIAMFCVGADSIDALRRVELMRRGEGRS